MLYREYGRSITKVIEQVSVQPDGEKKDEAARAVVYAMSMVAGMSVKDDVAYHKLWDHLMVMSHFRLEHAWPFPAEELAELKLRAQQSNETVRPRLPYKDKRIQNRQYGAYLEDMICKLKDTPDGEEYDAMLQQVSQQAKRSYLVWNGELSDDNIIVEHISRLSGDPRVMERLVDKKIVVPPNTLPTDIMQSKKKKKKK